MRAKASFNRSPSCCHKQVSCESGRPDLNRGPPAPKAGAIPGYATPRMTSPNLQCPAALTQRSHQCTKCAPAMTHFLLFLDRSFAERLGELRGKEVAIISESFAAPCLVD